MPANTHFYVMTFHTATGMSMWRGPVAVTPGTTRDLVFEQLREHACTEQPALRSGVVVCFYLEPLAI